MVQVRGQITSSKPDPDYRGHSVRLRFQRAQGNSPAVPTSVSMALDMKGLFVADMGAQTRQPYSIEVLAPNGTLLFSGDVSPPELRRGIERQVNPAILAPIISRQNDPQDKHKGKKTRRIRGRVLDSSGHGLGGAAVVLRARDKGEDTEFHAVQAAVTDRNGNFFADYPYGVFAEAYGQVGGAKDESVPIGLQDGEFPDFVLLVLEGDVDKNLTDEDAPVPRAPDPLDLVNAPEIYSQDLGTSCVSLAIPDRTVEEYSYYQIVRTTDPDIRPMDATGRPAHSSSARADLSAANPIDWDMPPILYQATSVAHGHILTFKQTWRADGYSMGDLVYSLPLAPCQKKRIAVIDWQRREQGSRSEAMTAQDQLEAGLSRDRTIDDVVNLTVDEMLKGGSVAFAEGGGGGMGGAGSYGMFSGAAGAAQGHGVGASYASQRGTREIAGESSQRLRDTTLQSASTVRSQRATVIQTVSQEESMRIETEVVANHNHCHALTIEYFEVLKHFQISQELARVQECLFIPLSLSPFTDQKALKWHEALKRNLLDKRLAGGFDALHKVQTGFVDSGLPDGAAASEDIREITGSLEIEFSIKRPRDNTQNKAFDAKAWTFWKNLMTGNALDYWKSFLKNASNRDAAFQEHIAPLIAKAFVSKLNIDIMDKAGAGHDDLVSQVLITPYSQGIVHHVNIKAKDEPRNLCREDVENITIHIPYGLPEGSVAFIRDASFNYQTASLEETLIREEGIVEAIESNYTSIVFDPVELNRNELRDLQSAVRQKATELLAHLNANLVHYHQVIWTEMDPAHRFMLLDGFLAPSRDATLPRLSIASVVENRVVAIVGNSLVMPVTPGFNLDPSLVLEGEDATMLDFYDDGKTDVEPARVSVPQGGVYAEAVLGKCCACEKIDDTRFWRWEESPCPDEPTEILPIDAGSRRADPGDLSAEGFASPIIAIQQAPQAPDPQGLSAAMQVLASMGGFRDVTGLTQNQLNAIRALEKTQDTAVAFGKMAADLQTQNMKNRGADRGIDRIDKAVKKGDISPEKGQELREGWLQAPGSGGGDFGSGEVESLLDKAGENNASVSYRDGTGKSTDIDARPSNEPHIAAEAPVESPSINLSANNFDVRAFFPDDRDTPEVARPPALKNGGTVFDVGLENFEDVTDYNLCFSVVPENAVLFDTLANQNLPARAFKPGISTVTVTAQKEPCGQDSPLPIATATMAVSVPQYVLVSDQFPAYVDNPGFAQTHIQNMGTFSSFLNHIQLSHRREDILAEAKATADHLLSPANVRVVWNLLSSPETLPEQFETTDYPAAGSLAAKELVTHAVLLDWFNETSHPEGGSANPRTLTGETRGLVSNEHALDDATKDSFDLIRTYRYNERIYIWPRANLDVSGGVTSSQGQRLTSQLMAAYQAEGNATRKAALETLAVQVFGRQIGSTLAHEVSHSIVGTDSSFFDEGGHMENSVGADLMSPGSSNLFAHKTGIHVKDETLWPAVNSYDDNRFSPSGLGRRSEHMQTMSTFTRNLLKRHFPVEPKADARRRE